MRLYLPALTSPTTVSSGRGHLRSIIKSRFPGIFLFRVPSDGATPQPRSCFKHPGAWISCLAEQCPLQRDRSGQWRPIRILERRIFNSPIGWRLRLSLLPELVRSLRFRQCPGSIARAAALGGTARYFMVFGNPGRSNVYAFRARTSPHAGSRCCLGFHTQAASSLEDTPLNFSPGPGSASSAATLLCA
jgi:hypothetical protein